MFCLGIYLPRGFAVVRKGCKILAALLCFLAACGGGFCAQGAAGNDSRLVRLAEGVYARIVSPNGNAVSNAGFVVLDRSVLVFDTHFTPEAGGALLDAVRSVTSKPVRYVVNRHLLMPT
jgi:hypothetical protein